MNEDHNEGMLAYVSETAAKQCKDIWVHKFKQSMESVKSKLTGLEQIFEEADERFPGNEYFTPSQIVAMSFRAGRTQGNIEQFRDPFEEQVVNCCEDLVLVAPRPFKYYNSLDKTDPHQVISEEQLDSKLVAELYDNIDDEIKNWLYKVNLSRPIMDELQGIMKDT